MRLKLSKSFVKGSLILLIAFNLFNALNFFFHFVMARMLTISDYGVLAALFSTVYILGIFSESIQLVITKFASLENKPGKLKNIFFKSLKKASKFSFALFILYLIIGIPLSSLLKISYPLFVINGLMVFVAFYIPVGRGMMQGRKMFGSLGANMIIESGFKLILGIAFVFIGLGVYGAVTGAVIGPIIAILFSFLFLKKIMKSKEEKTKTLGIYTYTRPVFVTMFSLLVFYSIDIIIAKIVFSPEVAGFYAIASILGKTIFWGTQPISKAMFPLTTDKKYSKKKITRHGIFANALGILLGLLIVAWVIFYFFPDILVRVFSGKTIPESSSILFFMALATGLLSLANLNLLYKLSRGKTQGYFYFLIFVVIEIALLFYFSASLLQFSIAFMTSSAIFLWGTVVLMNK
jgi:O-antigen/teichoic acid export membrane protein